MTPVVGVGDTKMLEELRRTGESTCSAELSPAEMAK
jgi:hypothetical protein